MDNIRLINAIKHIILYYNRYRDLMLNLMTAKHNKNYRIHKRYSGFM